MEQIPEYRYNFIVNLMCDKIVNFYHTDKKNEWLTYKDVSIYVRNARRILDSTRGLEKVLDLASVDIGERLQGKGIFTKILDRLKLEIPIPIRIENVLNERLAEFLSKDWTVIYEGGDLPTFIYRKDQKDV